MANSAGTSSIAPTSPRRSIGIGASRSPPPSRTRDDAGPALHGQRREMFDARPLVPREPQPARAAGSPRRRRAVAWRRVRRARATASGRRPPAPRPRARPSPGRPRTRSRAWSSSTRRVHVRDPRLLLEARRRRRVPPRRSAFVRHVRLAVDLGHERREHRRARRHLDDRDPRAAPLGHRPRADRAGAARWRGTAARVRAWARGSRGCRPRCGAAAQEVVAHHAVEVHRARDADVERRSPRTSGAAAQHARPASARPRRCARAWCPRARRSRPGTRSCCRRAAS